MLGNPITYAKKIAEGSKGYIVVVKLNDLLADEITRCWLVRDLSQISGYDNSILKLSSVGYDRLFDFLESGDVEGAYSWDKENLWIYVNEDEGWPYTTTVNFFVSGYRTAIPIRDEDSYIDVPEEDIELFVKYTIKESAQLRGKLIPSSIGKDILEEI